MTITVEYIDIAELPTEPFSYVGYVLANEMKWFTGGAVLALALVLFLLSRVFMLNRNELMKENKDYEIYDDTSSTLLNFEVFISFDQMVSSLSIIGNGV